MFFGIPDTGSDDINDPGHWAQILGFCDALAATSRPCSYDDGTPECQKALARGRPCSFSIVRALRWMERNEPERSWTEKWGNRPECPPVSIHPRCGCVLAPIFAAASIQSMLEARSERPDASLVTARRDFPPDARGGQIG